MKFKIVFFSFFLAFQLCTGRISAEEPDTPPMGWNSWNWHGKQNINEKIVMETIDAMVESGLRDAGYTFVVIDGGWRATHLGNMGELLFHSDKFPNGIKPIAEYAHSKGMKLGLHIVPGTHDCGNDKVGSLGKEQVHLQQFIEWGIDFIKLDKCNYSYDENPDYPPSDKRWKAGWEKESNIEEVYRKWSELIKASGADITLSISAYQYRSWYPEVCNMARTTPDIRARKHPGGAQFEPGIASEVPKQGGLVSVMQAAELNNEWAQFAGNGYWNDPDMLVTGGQGLTLEEEKSHFALWCIMSAPLFLGNDPRRMSESEMEIIMNEYAIMVNQDPTEQGERLSIDDKKEIWGKKLENGNMAILLLNRDVERSARFDLDLKTLGIEHGMKIFDIYEKKVLENRAENLSVVLSPQTGYFLLLTKN